MEVVVGSRYRVSAESSGKMPRLGMRGLLSRLLMVWQYVCYVCHRYISLRVSYKAANHSTSAFMARILNKIIVGRSQTKTRSLVYRAWISLLNSSHLFCTNDRRNDPDTIVLPFISLDPRRRRGLVLRPLNTGITRHDGPWSINRTTYTTYLRNVQKSYCPKAVAPLYSMV